MRSFEKQMVKDQRPIEEIMEQFLQFKALVAYPELACRIMRGATGLDFLKTGVN